MASSADRTPDNAPGRYYVDASCIDCDQCRTVAPEIFAHNDETGVAFVRRQPATEDEFSLAEEALVACAPGAIGNDGI